MTDKKDPPPPGDRDTNGTNHARLHGAERHFRFRTERLKSSSLEYLATCRFTRKDLMKEGIAVVDVSATGLGIAYPEGTELRAGDLLEDFHFEHRGKLVWKGAVRVANIHPGEDGRCGVQFLGPPLDLPSLRIFDEVVEKRMGSTLEALRQLESLPAGWRARCLDLYLLLVEVHKAFDEMEALDPEGHWRQPDRSMRLCRAMFDRTWPRFKELIELQEKETSAFVKGQIDVGLDFAQRLFMLEYDECEFPHRAFHKPQGYAGDYRMMELAQSPVLQGETLFQRFVHYYAQHTSLGRTIKGRAEVALQAAQQAVDRDRPTRILSMASGPAVELRRMVAQQETFAHPVELLLIDQDEAALAASVSELDRVIGNRTDRPPVTVKGLHFSLRQLLAPKKGAERDLVQNEIEGVDLVYCMGMFDYLLAPLAQRTASLLFQLLNPGGRLLIGNLMRVPDSSWQIEFATAWHLIYRTEAEMVDMAEKIQGAETLSVTKDDTGHCLFLDARSRA